MKIRFSEEAREEYFDAIRWYSNISTKLAEQFCDRIDETIARICRTPESWPFADGTVQLCHAKQFPYAIFYCQEGELILLYGVMHQKRKPRRWQ